MNHETSPRIRSFLSGLAAIALTTVIAATLVESAKPVLALGNGKQLVALDADALSHHGDATLVRSV